MGISALFVISFLLCCAICKSEKGCPTKCADDKTGKNVAQYCNHNNATMIERCCIKNDRESDIIGLDLTNCGLTVLNVTSRSHYNRVVILDLCDNELNRTLNKDFIGFTHLKYLFLPPKSECPGGEHAWNSSDQNDNGTVCYTELNACQYLNVSCTINGKCSHTGPGSAKCYCLPDHHGYKCLEQGEFPTETFVISLCVPTIFLSVVLWYTQRRHVIKED